MHKILVIDDEEANVRVLSMSLRADGYEVVSAFSGQEGLQVFEVEAPDVVLTDIKMPGMDGIEVLKAIKARRPDAEVIIITGHGDIDNAIEALQFGASDFINKPIRDEALAVALKRAHEKLDIKRQLKEYTDNLEKKVAEATVEIRRRSNFQTKLIKSSNDGIVATDRQLKIVIFNPGAERIFGCAAEAVMGRKSIEDIYTPELAKLFKAGMTDKEKRKEIAWQETTIRTADGEEIPVGVAGSILREKGRKMGTVAFFQDLRELKRLERELLQSERLAAVGQTVAGLAHGIKNILHGLKGGSYLVDLGIKKGDTQKLETGWDMVHRNITRTSNLVMDLLSYSKERQPEYRVCQPNDIVTDVCELLQERTQRHQIALSTELDDAIGNVCMDPDTLHSVLLNLVSNAVDACLFDEDTRKQWQIRVTTRRKTGRQIGFEVADNGVGMSDEVQAKLFMSFFSTKGHRGTGLGLMVTRKLIEEHGGKITVNSQPSVGTTFRISLPFDPPEACQ